jgi:hypothetical protein
MDMTRKIIAFFASSVLSVALTIPAKAEEKTGIVAAIDPDASLLTMVAHVIIDEAACA